LPPQEAGKGLAVGYVRVSGLIGDPFVEVRMIRLQTQRVVRQCEHSGWTRDELFVDRDRLTNPGLTGALELIRQHRHQALVVAFFDRLTVAQSELVALYGTATEEGWVLIVAR
jgi:hypothetical protein